MHFIYHDGTVKDVDTLDQMYMKKPQKQPVRLAFDPGWQIEADIYKTNELYEGGAHTSLNAMRELNCI